MDFADRLDFMDDDCDIQGFPLEEEKKMKYKFPELLKEIKELSIDEKEWMCIWMYFNAEQDENFRDSLTSGLKYCKEFISERK
jgi:hypothetical protein